MSVLARPSPSRSGRAPLGAGARLIILSGQSCVGKTSLSRTLCRLIGAVHLRVDTIEGVLKDGGVFEDMADAGYRISYGIAADNLAAGHSVVADQVNPIPLTRAAWQGVAEAAGVPYCHILVVCSNRAEWRRRTLAREGAAHWERIKARTFVPFTPDFEIDTASRSPEMAAREAAEHLGFRQGASGSGSG
ncbi:MAG: ATP-binding protein [Pseudomonadota bacterium]